MPHQQEFPDDYTPAMFSGTAEKGNREVIGVALRTEEGVQRYRLGIDDALRLFDHLHNRLGSHHGEDATLRDNARRFFSPGGRKPPGEAWVIEVDDSTGTYHLRRYADGKAREAYRRFAWHELDQVMAIISASKLEPGAIRELPMDYECGYFPHDTVGLRGLRDLYLRSRAKRRAEALEQREGGLSPIFKAADLYCTVPAVDAIGVGFRIEDRVLRIRLSHEDGHQLIGSMSYFLGRTSSQSPIADGGPQVDGSSPHDGKNV